MRQVQGAAVVGVLALVDQVEHLHDDRVFEQLVHVHFEHDVETVFALGHVEDRLIHELVQLSNMRLLLEIFFQ